MNWQLVHYAVLVLIALGHSRLVSAQFFDGFDNLKLDPENGWFFKAGDGTATMDFRQEGPGYASIFVDGTTDRRGRSHRRNYVDGVIDVSPCTNKFDRYGSALMLPP